MEKNGCEREKRAQKWSGGSKRESKNRTENGGEDRKAQETSFKGSISYFN